MSDSIIKNVINFITKAEDVSEIEDTIAAALEVFHSEEEKYEFLLSLDKEIPSDLNENDIIKNLHEKKIYLEDQQVSQSIKNIKEARKIIRRLLDKYSNNSK